MMGYLTLPLGMLMTPKKGNLGQRLVVVHGLLLYHVAP